MPYREIIAVCSQIHTKHINTLCGQNVEFVNVKRRDTYSEHWVVNLWPSIYNYPVDVNPPPKKNIYLQKPSRAFLPFFSS